MAIKMNSTHSIITGIHIIIVVVDNNNTNAIIHHHYTFTLALSVQLPQSTNERSAIGVSTMKWISIGFGCGAERDKLPLLLTVFEHLR
jgi:hypothetical protein